MEQILHDAPAPRFCKDSIATFGAHLPRDWRLGDLRAEKLAPSASQGHHDTRRWPRPVVTA